MSLNGYDISNNQGDINNGKVPGDFVIIKATEGVGWTDPNCDANYQQAKKAGKLLGVYHFARPDGNTAVAEAHWFVSQVKGYVGNAVLVLDLEVNPITPKWAKAWLDEVYKLTSVRPWLYMSQSKFNSGDWSAVLKDYAAWVAQYPSAAQVKGYKVPKTPTSIKPSGTIAAWQYTSNGLLSNWGGRLDLNVFYGDKAAWTAYAKKHTASPVVHAPQPAPTPIPTPKPTTDPSPAPAPVTEPPVQQEPTSTPVDTPTDIPPTAPISDSTPPKTSPGNTIIAIIVALVAAILAAIGLSN